MTRQDAWNGVDVLIPSRSRDRREDVVRVLRPDALALLAALPSQLATAQKVPALDLPAEADERAWKAWIANLIEALPTHTHFSPEAAHGVA